MPEPKVRCSRCNVEFLRATAERTGGICMRCKRAAEIAEAQSKQGPYTPVPPVSRIQLEILIATATPTELIDALFDPACDKVNFRPGEMTDGDIIVYTVWTFLGEVINGGIIQYLTNQSGRWAHFCGKSLRQIGATKYGEVIEECIAAFTTKDTPAEWEEDLDAYWHEHHEPFEDIEKKFWVLHWKNEQELPNLLASYIKGHPDLFAR